MLSKAELTGGAGVVVGANKCTQTFSGTDSKRKYNEAAALTFGQLLVTSHTTSAM